MPSHLRTPSDLTVFPAVAINKAGVNKLLAVWTSNYILIIKTFPLFNLDSLMVSKTTTRAILYTECLKMPYINQTDHLMAMEKT